MFNPTTRITTDYGEGTVLRQEGSMVTVELDDGMEISVPAADCSPAMTIAQRVKLMQSNPVSIPTSSGKKSSSLGMPLVVDLHQEILVKEKFSCRNDLPFERQMEKFDVVMRQNIHRKGTRIVFIHGIGSGKLHEAIVGRIKSQWRSCEWQDAPYYKYGVRGAIQITMK